MTPREAFILGTVRFCKEAGLDADDTWQMTHLLLMPPLQAAPILKKASVKWAANVPAAASAPMGSYVNTPSGAASWYESPAQPYGAMYQPPVAATATSQSPVGGANDGSGGYDWKPRYASRNDINKLVTLQQEPQRAEAAAWKKNRNEVKRLQATGKPEDAAKAKQLMATPVGRAEDVATLQALGQKANVESHKSTAAGRAGGAAPTIATGEEAATAGMTPEQRRLRDFATASPGSAMRLGQTPQMMADLAEASGDEAARKDMDRDLRYRLDVADLRQIDPDTLAGTSRAKFEGALRLAQKHNATARASERAVIPTSTRAPQQTAAGQVQAGRGMRPPQLDSSPPLTGAPAGSSSMAGQEMTSVSGSGASPMSIIDRSGTTPSPSSKVPAQAAAAAGSTADDVPDVLSREETRARSGGNPGDRRQSAPQSIASTASQGRAPLSIAPAAGQAPSGKQTSSSPPLTTMPSAPASVAASSTPGTEGATPPPPTMGETARARIPELEKQKKQWSIKSDGQEVGRGMWGMPNAPVYRDT